MKTYYIVAVDTILPGGQTLMHDRRSRKIARESIMRRVLKRVRRRLPQAYGVRVDQYR